VRKSHGSLSALPTLLLFSAGLVLIEAVRRGVASLYLSIFSGEPFCEGADAIDSLRQTSWRRSQPAFPLEVAR
jgi:hypothetical protein